MMNKRDILLSLITGEGTAWLFVWFVRKSELNLKFLNWFLPIFLPILFLFSVWLAFLIGKKLLFVFQLAKFLLIGIFFALIDLTILNFLMVYFDITTGIRYLIFVMVSFIVATSLKFIADKYWAFESRERTKIETELSKFFLITLISGGIQTIVADFIVNKIGVQCGIDPLVWGNIGKIFGIATASAWNFLGYKFIVFKK